MLSVKIEEPKHKVNDVIKKQGASATTVHLFETFLNEIKSSLGRQGKTVKFRSHIYGVTAFCSEHKAFMFVNVRKNFVSTLYFTGKGKIPGLAKKNWLTGTDNEGSETYRITDEMTLKSALAYASVAWDLASRN